MATALATPGPVLAPSTPSPVDDTLIGHGGPSPTTLMDTSSSKNVPLDVEKGVEDGTNDHSREANYLVEFDGPDDPGNPKNWTKRRRWAITISMGLLVFTVTFASSVFSVNIGVVQEKYDTNQVTATLGVSLFVLGFVFGPIVFGPMSEVLGRRTPLLLGFALFAIFQIPVALAQNVATINIGRFLGGFFASSPLAVNGGALADLWDPIPRSYAVCVFATGGFAGPVAGPIVGGFIAESNLGWRWTSWITLIMAGFFGTIALLVIPETSAARILQRRAANLRRETGNAEYHSKADLQKLTMKTIFSVFLFRPFVMFVQEPILALITAYMSFLYGILYLLFEAFPVSFHHQRGWSLSISQLPFFSFLVGLFLGAGIMAYSAATNFTRAYNKHGKAIPEERLPPMIVGAVALPIGLFWFAWTSDADTFWVPQVLSISLMGIGCMVPFWQGLNYLIDCYGFYSNSAIAINTFVRSIAGAFFPLFTHAMYTRLGVAWASSILGFLCVFFLPVPVLFYFYGAKVRAKSKWAPTAPSK